MISDVETGAEKKRNATETECPAPAGEVFSVGERFFGMAGMSRRAGKTVFGADLVIEKARGKNKPALVVISSFASENTKERLIAKCAYYGVPYVVVAVDGEELSRRLGKTGYTAVFAVTDPALANEIRKACTCIGKGSPTDGDGSTGNRG